MNRNAIKVAQLLLLLSAIIWIAFSAAYLFRFSATVPTYIIAALMFVNAMIFLALAWGISKRNRWIFYFTILFLIGHIILTITDDFGIFDLLVLVIDLVTLGLLVFKRQLFTEKYDAVRS